MSMLHLVHSTHEKMIGRFFLGGGKSIQLMCKKRADQGLGLPYKITKEKNFETPIAFLTTNAKQSKDSDTGVLMPKLIFLRTALTCLLPCFIGG